MLPLAVLGAVILRRRNTSLVVLMAPVILVTVIAALRAALPRYRYAADLVMIVRSGVALVQLYDRREAVLGRRAPRL